MEKNYYTDSIVGKMHTIMEENVRLMDFVPVEDEDEIFIGERSTYKNKIEHMLELTLEVNSLLKKLLSEDLPKYEEEA